jgi:hypothetical protein
MSLLQAKFELTNLKYHTYQIDQMEGEVRPGEVNYFPEHSVLVFACPKCGSSSMYNFLYTELIGPVNYSNLTNFLSVPSPDWKGQMIGISLEEAATRNADPEVFSFALIRDPIERFISSWKSKAACDSNCFTTDKEDRNDMVPELLALAGNTAQAKCLSFSDFVDVILSVHIQGKAQQLNKHFLPQHLQPAFEAIPVDKWDYVSQISSNMSAEVLAEHLGDKNATGARFPDEHASDRITKFEKIPDRSNCTNDGLVESVEDKEKVALITKPEYDVLGPYLSK